MLVPGSANPLLLRTVAAAPSGGVSRSLRFNAPDSAYLSRTPASAGNRKTFTFATWIKRSLLSDRQNFFGTGDASFNYSFWIEFFGTTLRFGDYTTSHTCLFETSQVFRDPSSWGHVVIAFDTTQATDTNRVKVYWNGLQITAFSTASYPTQNLDTQLNAATLHSIGRAGSYNAQYFSGYLADTYFIDGQQLDPSSFTETDATTGQLIPKAFSGSYGTNGFHLDFADNSAATATTLGKDTSGNGNNWTPNNLSVTAGAGNDSLVDVPTNGAQTDTGVGGEVRGNYCTWNPVANFNGSTLSNGNLDVVTPGAAGGGAVFGTIAIPSSGKWYWEVVVTSSTLPSQDIAFAGITKPINGIYQNRSTTAYAEIYFLGGGIGGTVFSSTGSRTNGAEINVGNVCGIAVDRDNGAIYFYKNGVANGSVTGFTFVDGMFPYVEDNSGGSGQSSITANFGQRAFAYTAPSGFKALCTTNLPAPLVTKPNTVMDVKLYTGNGSTQTISGLGFSPDFVWLKLRSGNDRNILTDAVRGPTLTLNSDSTRDEATATEPNQVTAYTSTGFSVGSNSNVNGTSSTFVAWCWDAGTSTVTNTQGSITSSVRANASAGFSVVTYTGNGVNGATVGHGLGVAPSLLICKVRNASDNWCVYHVSTGASLRLNLNTTSATTSGTAAWGTAPTSSVFSIGTSGEVNTNGNTYVCYAFAPVTGYSSFGSYTGNGSADGPFVYTGFRSRWIMVKRSDSTGNWTIKDTSRPGYNVTNLNLFSNLSTAETTEYPVDLLSNGFKVREGTFSDWNTNGGTYVWAAFAESPFNYSRAR